MLLRHIRYFLAVAEQGNFTRAAEALHVSQPTLSQQIKQLEDALGAPLFDRSGRAVRLTDAGEAWMRYARLALQDLDAGARAIHDVATLARGHLRLAMTPTFTAYLVGPTIDAFYQIKQLESRLGTLLLVRTTRSMSLTEAGQLYYQEACRLLGEFDALEQTVAASAQQVSGTLRVNAPLSFGLTVLSPLLPPFMQRYPQLQVELTLDDRVLDVVAAGFDISLRIRRRLPDSSLSARALGDVHQRICAAPGYLAQHGVPQTPNELPRHSCLAYSLAEKPGQWQFTAGEESLSVTFTPRLIANNSLMLRDMLVAGLGIGSLPSFVADPEIAAGRLVQLFPEQIADVHQVFAVYPTRRHVQQKVSLFTELVREQGLMTAN